MKFNKFEMGKRGNINSLNQLSELLLIIALVGAIGAVVIIILILMSDSIAEKASISKDQALAENNPSLALFWSIFSDQRFHEIMLVSTLIILILGIFILKFNSIIKEIKN